MKPLATVRASLPESPTSSWSAETNPGDLFMTSSFMLSRSFSRIAASWMENVPQLQTRRMVTILRMVGIYTERKRACRQSLVRTTGNDLVDLYWSLMGRRWILYVVMNSFLFFLPKTLPVRSLPMKAVKISFSGSPCCVRVSSVAVYRLCRRLWLCYW